jgi:carbon monoxide dehydrogenase subunit G
MDLAGEYTFDAPQDLVWQALQDPDVLSSAMPGGEDFQEIGENEYAGKLNIRVGPVMGKFSGNIKLSDIVPPEGYTMVVEGKGAPGFVKATGKMQLTGQEEKTHMSYEGTAQIGGRIASVGQRLMDASAKSIIKQSLEGLNEYLKIQAAAAAATAPSAEPPSDGAEVGADEETPAATEAPATVEVQAPVSTYKPPSQTTVALNVAKDVAGDLVPSKYRPVVVGLVAIIIIAILYLILI